MQARSSSALPMALFGWLVRRLALEVGRGTNITIPGTKFLVFERMPNCFLVPVTDFLLCWHVAVMLLPFGGYNGHADHCFAKQV